MLRKLLKYEIKATARIFLPIYLALLLVSVVNQLIPDMNLEQAFTLADILGIITALIYVLIIVGMFVMTLIVTIQRFYKNLLADEGYLMFTLPVESWKHIMSKLLISVMWSVISVFVAFVSVMIIERVSLAELSYYLKLFYTIIESYFESRATLMIAESILTALLVLVSSGLMIYAAIAIGQLCNKHRILSSVGAYSCIYIINQILMTIALFIAFGSGIFTYGIFDEPSNVFILLRINNILLIVTGVAYFLITNFILTKKLNLE